MKKVARVEREDCLTRLEGLVNLTTSLLERPVIVAELASRGLDQATLESLRDDAQSSVAAGKNVRLAAEATAQERDAVAKQKAAWTGSAA